MQLSGMALYTLMKGGRDDGTNTLAPKDVVCTVPKQHSGKIKTRALPSPSHVSVCVRKTKEKKKVTNYRRIYNLQDPLCKLSLSPLIKASQEMGLFFAKHWFTCGNSLENCFSVTSALMLGFLQAAISPTKPAHLQHIHCILLSFPRHQATEKHMWLQQR